MGVELHLKGYGPDFPFEGRFSGLGLGLGLQSR